MNSGAIVPFAAIVHTHFALAGLALRDVSPSTGVSPLALTPAALFITPLLC